MSGAGQSFVHRIDVAFGDADLAGILYYPRLFHYCHVAMEAYFPARTGRSYRDWLIEADVGFPAVRMEADYLHPMPLGAHLDIALGFPRVGGASLEVAWRVQIDGQTHARVQGTLVCVQMSAFKSQRIPDALREVFTRTPAPIQDL